MDPTSEETCRWRDAAAFQTSADSKLEGPLLIDLSPLEQVSRGQTLLQMLQHPGEANPVSQLPGSGALSTYSATEAAAGSGSASAFAGQWQKSAPSSATTMRKGTAGSLSSQPPVHLPPPPRRPVPPPPPGFALRAGAQQRRVAAQMAAAAAKAFSPCDESPPCGADASERLAAAALDDECVGLPVAASAIAARHEPQVKAMHVALGANGTAHNVARAELASRASGAASAVCSKATLHVPSRAPGGGNDRDENEDYTELSRLVQSSLLDDLEPDVAEAAVMAAPPAQRERCMISLDARCGSAARGGPSRPPGMRPADGATHMQLANALAAAAGRGLRADGTPCVPGNFAALGLMSALHAQHQWQFNFPVGVPAG